MDILEVLRERIAVNFWHPMLELTTTKWLRLVIFVCGYMLLRPYILKMSSKSQMQGFENASADEAEKKKPKTANTLRDKVDIPDDTDDEDEGDPANIKATEWGTKARRRQRRVIKKILEAEEKRLQDVIGDDEDKDIEEFLED